MRIFIATELIDMSITIKIQKDDGSWIALKGRRDNSYTPVFNVVLNEGAQEKLIEWINIK